MIDHDPTDAEPREHGALRDLRPTLLIADDDAIMRAALRSQLKDSFQIVAVGEDATEAIALAEQHQPDAALLDVEMPGGGARVAVPQIDACSPGTCIVILSGTSRTRSSSSSSTRARSPTSARASPPAGSPRPLPTRCWSRAARRRGPGDAAAVVAARPRPTARAHSPRIAAAGVRRTSPGLPARCPTAERSRCPRHPPRRTARCGRAITSTIQRPRPGSLRLLLPGRVT